MEKRLRLFAAAWERKGLHMAFSPFDFVKTLSFVRYGGTPEERRAAGLIRDAVESAGGSCEFMEFQIPASICKHCVVETVAPVSHRIDAVAFGMCAGIPAPGKTFQLYYAERGTERDYLGRDDLSDTVVMLNTLSLDAYKQLCARHAGAILVIAGKYYQSAAEAGIYARNLRPKFLEYGNIPTFSVSAHDATELIRSGVGAIHIELEHSYGEASSQNVLATVGGTQPMQESIVLTAHYDSVPLGAGAWDNATGSAALLGLYFYFLAHPVRRTLRFIWCGAEEQGLLGSKAYAAQHEAELANIKFCFNFDMCGTILGNNQIFITGGKELETFVDQYCRETGYSASTRTGVHSSDSAPFADHGIPSLGLSRGTSTSEIHTCRDQLFPIGEQALLQNIRDFTGLVSRVADSAVLPVDTGMPEEMKKELDKYFQRD